MSHPINISEDRRINRIAQRTNLTDIILPTNTLEARNAIDRINPRVINDHIYGFYQLKKIAANLGLSTDGNRAELANRILDYINNQEEVIVEDTFPKAEYEALLKQFYNL